MTKTYNYFKSRSGFTLIELVVVVVIVGALASIALPRYVTFKERAIVAEALNAFGTIKKAEEMQRLETGSYITCQNAAQFAANLSLTFNQTNWVYLVVSFSSSTFIIEADRTSANNGNSSLFILFTWDSTTRIGTWSGNHPNTPEGKYNPATAKP